MQEIGHHLAFADLFQEPGQKVNIFPRCRGSIQINLVFRLSTSPVFQWLKKRNTLQQHPKGGLYNPTYHSNHPFGGARTSATSKAPVPLPLPWPKLNLLRPRVNTIWSRETAHGKVMESIDIHTPGRRVGTPSTSTLPPCGVYCHESAPSTDLQHGAGMYSPRF